MSVIYLFVIKTDKEINEQNTSFTQDEKEKGLHSKFVPFNEFEEFAKDVAQNNEKELNRTIAREILNGWNEYKALNNL